MNSLKLRAPPGVAAAVLLVLALATPARAGEMAVGGSQEDLKKVAERVATEVAPVKPGQLVRLFGDVRTMPFVTELMLALERQGASVLANVYDTRTAPRFYTEVPQSQDLSRIAWEGKLATLTELHVSVDANFDPGILREVPADRLAARSKAIDAAMNPTRVRKVPSVSIGNGLYPTEATAKELGLTQPELERLFWSAMMVPAADLAREGENVKRVLASGKKVRVTGSNGTDLTFSIEGRRAFVSNGVITAETREQGDVATWLPAGEVYLAPVKGSARGKVVVDRQPHAGGFIEKLTLTVEGGKITAHTASPSPAYDRFKQQWDAGPAGKEDLGTLDFGVNRGAVVPGGKAVQSWIPAGMVSLQFGGNLWAGGDNVAPFAFSVNLPGLTVTVDGKPLVERGVLRTVTGST